MVSASCLPLIVLLAATVAGAAATDAASAGLAMIGLKVFVLTHLP